MTIGAQAVIRHAGGREITWNKATLPPAQDMCEWQIAGGSEGVLRQELCMLLSFLHPLLVMAGDDNHCSWNMD